jgi:cell fate (sporulation/competence/biofilm development) regulator YmcA (YheA/YmcA/DUF963 family)
VRKINKEEKWSPGYIGANVDAALDAAVQRREEQIRFEAREAILQAEFIKNRRAEALKAAEEELSARIRSMPVVDDIDMLF